MKFDHNLKKMWTEAKNKSLTVVSDGNSPKMVDPHLTRQLLDAIQQRNGSTAAGPSSTDSVTRSSGIIPGAIAATVFIALILALYTVLWRCMDTPPQRKHSKVRVRVHPRNIV